MGLLRKIYNYFIHPEYKILEDAGMEVVHYGRNFMVRHKDSVNQEPLGFPDEFARRVSWIHRDID